MSVRRTAAVVLLLMLLTACKRSAPVATTPPPPPDEQGHTPRPAPPLGVYVSLFLAQNGYLPVAGAVQGAAAARSFFMLDPEKDLEDTFALLQEFGAVLGENIPDLLNRSDDRPSTLNAYMQGLSNINERAKRRKTELDASLQGLQQKQTETSRTLSDIERSIREANTKRDYATAGGLQSERQKADQEHAKVEADIRQIQDIRTTYEQLLEIAKKRIDAINSNREALIAGVKVVDMPGIEDLGIIKNPNQRSGGRTSNFDFNDL